MIWVIFAAMAAVALAFLLAPLLRSTKAKAATRADYDLMVYRDQLAELDREVERGVLTADQADAARTEIQRRMLAAADVGGNAAPSAPPRRSTMAAIVVAVGVPVFAFALYAMLGTPWLPDLPHAARKAEPSQTMAQQMAMVSGMVERLAARLEQNPDDGKGWAMLGRSYRVLGRFDEAKAAYAKAVRLLPGDADVRMDYGGLLLRGLPRGAPLPTEFVRLMREVLGIEPDNGDALYFLGVAEAQSGRKAEARALWTRLLAQLPAGSAERAEIEQQLKSLDQP